MSWDGVLENRAGRPKETTSTLRDRRGADAAQGEDRGREEKRSNKRHRSSRRRSTRDKINFRKSCVLMFKPAPLQC